MKIGLLGGSFNPPHAGHIHASEIALKYLGLDAVWWLVSEGNPLKSKNALPDTQSRITLCRDLVKNPRIIVSRIESSMGTRRTFDTVTALHSHFPQTDFIWIAGTDIAYEFHRWYKWRALIRTLPFAFVGRPTSFGVVRQNVFRQSSTLRHIYPAHGIRPTLEKGQIYWLFADPQMAISSTLLRK
jgi:nicotinate-nucleotide adenylyltransferase